LHVSKEARGRRCVALPVLHTHAEGIPVDLVAGAHDGIIPPRNVAAHHAAMQAAGLTVTYKEFDFGHLDFTFGVKDDLKRYVCRLLRKPTAAATPMRS
jgi:lysosomal acid lipase/cholesteryl ester hydrolase